MGSKVSPISGPPLFADRRVQSLSKRRQKQPWPKDQPFKILSLDGGGIRGVYTAVLLRLLEEGITDASARIADYFDMICGTSTGGIIAIALGLRISTSAIEDLYMIEGGRIFPPFWTRHPTLALFTQLGRPLHDHKVLETLLFQTFGERLFGESSSRLVIPAFKAPKTEIAVFKTDHHPDFREDWKSYAWEIARATSAAPTYFAGHGRDGHVFLDGGVWANNPVMAGIIDALSAYDVDRDQIEVLSIGTGNAPLDVGAFAVRGGLFRWRKIINGAMFLTTDNASAQAQLLLGPEKIVRLQPCGDAASIPLDDWVRAKDNLPEQALQDFNCRRDALLHFVARKADARERHFTASNNS